MKLLLAAALTVTMAASMAPAQTTPQTAPPAVIEDFRPSSLNQPGQSYPQVNSQGYARFRITAPDAKAALAVPVVRSGSMAAPSTIRGR